MIVNLVPIYSIPGSKTEFANLADQPAATTVCSAPAIVRSGD